MEIPNIIIRSGIKCGGGGGKWGRFSKILRGKVVGIYIWGSYNNVFFVHILVHFLNKIKDFLEAIHFKGPGVHMRAQ